MKRFWNYLVDFAVGKRKVKLWLAILLLTFISTAVPTYLLFTKALPALKRAPIVANEIVNKSVPDDFRLEIKDGQATINQVEPFFVTVNLNDIEEFSFLANGTFKDFKKTNISKVRLLAVDTKATYKDFDRYQTWVLVTRDSLVYSSGGGVQVTQLRDVTNRVLTKEDLRTYVTQSDIMDTAKFFEVFIWILPGLLFVSQLFMYPLTFLWNAFVLWVIGRTIRVNPGWKNLYHLIVVLYFVPSIISDFVWLMGENGIFWLLIISGISNTIFMVGGYLVLKGAQRRYAKR